MVKKTVPKDEEERDEDEDEDDDDGGEIKGIIQDDDDADDDGNDHGPIPVDRDVSPPLVRSLFLNKIEPMAKSRSASARSPAPPSSTSRVVRPVPQLGRPPSVRIAEERKVQARIKPDLPPAPPVQPKAPVLAPVPLAPAPEILLAPISLERKPRLVAALLGSPESTPLSEALALWERNQQPLVPRTEEPALRKVTPSGKERIPEKPLQPLRGLHGPLERALNRNPAFAMTISLRHKLILAMAALVAFKTGEEIDNFEAAIYAFLLFPRTFGKTAFGELEPNSNAAISKLSGHDGLFEKGWLKKVKIQGPDGEYDKEGTHSLSHEGARLARSIFANLMESVRVLDEKAKLAQPVGEKPKP